VLNVSPRFSLSQQPRFAANLQPLITFLQHLRVPSADGLTTANPSQTDRNIVQNVLTGNVQSEPFKNMESPENVGFAMLQVLLNRELKAYHKKITDTVITAFSTDTKRHFQARLLQELLPDQDVSKMQAGHIVQRLKQFDPDKAALVDAVVDYNSVVLKRAATAETNRVSSTQLNTKTEPSLREFEWACPIIQTHFIDGRSAQRELILKQARSVIGANSFLRLDTILQQYKASLLI
jgi:hypothetical protein